MTDYDLSFIGDALPSQAEELLRQMGVSDADFSCLFSVSFRDVIQSILGLFQGGLRVPLSFLATGIGVLLLVSVTSAFGTKQSAARTFLSSLFLVTVCAVPLRTVVTQAVSAVRAGSAFVCTLIPGLAAIVAASGSPVLSVCWKTAVFSAAQTVAAAASGFMAPACGMMFGTGVLDCLTPDSETGDLTNKIRKCAVWVFSFLSTLFTAFLTLKGFLAGSADTVAAKGIKWAISSSVPVVGSQLSDAYASVAGSLSLVRSTAGVFAIAGVCAVSLPAAVQMLLWIAAMRALALLSSMLDQKNAEKLFGAFAAALSVLHACLLFVTVLYVLSIGIILTVKADL